MSKKILQEYEPLVTKLFKCSCHGEGIVLQKFEDGEIDMAMFTHGQAYNTNGPMKWKDRLRWCWRVLSKGQPFCDAVVLFPATARALGEELINLAKEEPQNEIKN